MNNIIPPKREVYLLSLKKKYAIFLFFFIRIDEKESKYPN